jgi:hypothetical protein
MRRQTSCLIELGSQTEKQGTCSQEGAYASIMTQSLNFSNYQHFLFRDLTYMSYEQGALGKL